jgi:hypothetical protein
MVLMFNYLVSLLCSALLCCVFYHLLLLYCLQLLGINTVIIIAVDRSVIMIPDGSVLVDKVVTGNLRILDH